MVSSRKQANCHSTLLCKWMLEELMWEGNPVIDNTPSCLLSNAARDKLGNYESRHTLNN